MPYRSAQTLSYLAIGGLGVMGISRLFSAVLGLAQVIAPDQSLDLGAGEESPVWLIAQGLIALVLLPAYIFTIVVFLMWLFRVYKNLEPLGAGSVEMTPGWAVGWWFIPLANLIKPFQAVRDAWLESDPDVDESMAMFSKVKGGAPLYMAFWWGLWIFSNIFSNITNGLVSTAGDTAFDGYIFIIEGLLWTITSLLAIFVVRDITERQELRSARRGEVRPTGPPSPPRFDQDDQP